MRLIACCFLMTLFSQIDRPLPIPHGKDETPVLRIKADPKAYFEDAAILCGVVEISDYYNYGYGHADLTHYVLEFRELGKSEFNIGSERLHLYLEKSNKSKSIIDAIIARATDARARYKHSVVRVRVHLHTARYYDGNQWSMMELDDVQFATDDLKGWKPWYFEKERLAREADTKKQQDRILAIQKQVVEDRIAQQKSDDATAAEFEKKQWRKWTRDGKEVEARYGGIVSGELKLITRDDEKFKIPVTKLSKEEQEWIKTKPWINKPAAKAKKGSP